MSFSDFQFCLFCEKMRRLRVIHHNHLRCLRNDTLKCDCGCWQGFIEDSIKSRDQDEEVRIYNQTKSAKSTQGFSMRGGRILIPKTDE